MNYLNYGFNWGQKSFVLKSKTPLEGYEEISYIDSKTKENKKTYHKYVKSVEGVVTKVDIKELPFGKFLNVYLQTDSDTVSSIQVPLKDKYGYSAEVKAMVSSLDNLKQGEPVSVSPTVTEFDRANGNKGKNVTFWFNYVNIKNEDNKSVSSGYIPYDDIPKAIREEKFGEISYNNDPVTKFYYDKIENLKTKFAGVSNTGFDEETISKVNNTTNGVLTPSTDFDLSSDDDDLPF